MVVLISVSSGCVSTASATATMADTVDISFLSLREARDASQ